MLAGALACSLVAPGMAQAAGGFSDPAGDSGDAPDITTVAVSDDASGNITFRVTVANQPDLAADAELVLVLDSDRNEATGDEAGFDYVVVLTGADDSWSFGRWSGSGFDFDAPRSTVRVDYAGGVATIAVNRSELSNTASFGFYLFAAQLDEAGEELASDDAPDETVFEYALAAAPATPASTKTFRSAATLPSLQRYTGARSIKHVRLSRVLYRTLKLVGVPRLLAVACWTPADFDGVAKSASVSTSRPDDSELVGFWLRRQPRWLHLSPDACVQLEALYATRQPTGARAFALTTMLHESIHAYGIGNEAMTNCFAVQLVPIAAVEMGFTPAKASYLGRLAIRKTRSSAPRGYWNAFRCRDGGPWDLLPRSKNLG
jgi:hypothetical protein